MTKRPYELDASALQAKIDELAEITINDLTSEFLEMPKGTGFLEFRDFRDAYEVLKRHTRAFHELNLSSVTSALRENSRVLGVVRAVLGLTAPEWAELTLSRVNVDVPQSYARGLDRSCRDSPTHIEEAFGKFEQRQEKARTAGRPEPKLPTLIERVYGLIETACLLIDEGAPSSDPQIIHRLDKFDTRKGRVSLAYAASENVPFSVLLYERYLGRPFASHKDAISEIIGDILENAIEHHLRSAGVSYRKTSKAEAVPDFDQAPDFCIPDEIDPVAVIEAKITSDDGTARDKVARVETLASQRDKHVAEGKKRYYQVIACIDGRGFKQRKRDMKKLISITEGKVFSTATLGDMVENTSIARLITKP